MSLPVSTARRAASSTKPWSSAAGGDVARCPGSGVGVERLDERGRRRRRRASTSTSALRRAVPLEDQRRPASRRASQPLEVVDHPLGVAVVERHGLRRRPAIAVADVDVDVDRRTVLATASSLGVPARRRRVEAERRHVHHGWPLRQRRARARRPGCWKAAAPRSIGACPPPAAAAQRRLAGTPRWCATRSCARVRIRSGSQHAARACRPACRSTSSSIVGRRAAGRQRLHALDRRCPRRACRGSRASSGCCSAELGGPRPAPRR